MRTSTDNASGVRPSRETSVAAHPLFGSRVTGSGLSPTRNGVRPQAIHGESATHHWRLEFAAGMRPVLQMSPKTDADGRRISLESPEATNRELTVEDSRILRDVLRQAGSQMSSSRTSQPGEPLHFPAVRFGLRAAKDLLGLSSSPVTRDLSRELETVQRGFGGGPAGMVERDVLSALAALQNVGVAR